MAKFTWAFLVAMLFFMAGMQQFLTNPAYATEPGPVVQSLSKVLDYYRGNNYSNATTWWDMVGLRGAGDETQTGWDSDKTSLYGNILGILAKGEDPGNALGGRDLPAELISAQDAATGSFGVFLNEHIWAMIALDAVEAQYDQEKAVAYLLSHQNPDGGFYYSAEWNSSDPDLTGMALMALAGHQTADGVAAALNQAVGYFKNIQLDSGGFDSWGTENPNSIATVISGLVAIGEDPLDESWKKNGKSMLDALLNFQQEDGSFFSPFNPGQADTMATYQALIALGDLQAQESVWQRLKENVQQGNSSSAISPVTATFDKNPSQQADLQITLTLNGNTLTGISGATPLTADSDYTLSGDGSVVTIKKEYLQQLATGTATLTFTFSAGNSQILQVTVTDTSQSGGGGIIPPPAGSITLSVIGKNGQEILAPTAVAIENGDTAYSVLVKGLGQGRVTTSGAGSSFYVSGIDGINAGDEGPLSGWMFSVNGIYPGISAAAFVVADGDIVAWRYTVNLGEDIGAPDDSGVGEDPGNKNSAPKGDLTGRQSNQEVLARLNDVTSQQQAAARLPENTPALNPSASEQVFLQTADGVLLAIPPGALRAQSAPVRIVVEMGSVTVPPKDDTGLIVMDPVKYQRSFTIRNEDGTIPSEGINFNAPVTLSFPVLPGDLPAGAAVGQLGIYWWDENRNDWLWVGGVYDPISESISVPVYHFSTYAVMADVADAPRRLAGADRFHTANMTAEYGWKAGAANVVLANAHAFADALAAVPLAFRFNAPILLTAKDSLTPSTREEIKKLAPQKIFLIGGEGVISQAIEEELENTYGAGNVLRYGGADRYSTAAQIAHVLGTGGKAVIACGEDGCFADALAISPYAAYKGIPILFTKKNALPDATAQALAKLNVTATIIVGGNGVVSAAVAGNLPGVVRYGGSDRYDTAAAIAQGLKLNTERVYIVTGKDFADALTAGNLAARTFSALLMVDEALPEATADYLAMNQGSISQLVIVGGTGIVSTEQENNLRAIVFPGEIDEKAAITRCQEADKAAAALAVWLKDYIQEAFNQAAGEVVDPTVYNWTMLGLSRLGLYEGLDFYLEENEKYIKQNWHDTVRLATNLARISLAVGAAGKDPRNFGDRDLIAAIANYPEIEVQGINGPIFALLALNGNDYELPAAALWTQERLLKLLLSRQLPDGGFSLDGTGSADVDITAMAIQALAPYYTAAYPEAKDAADKAISCLAALQEDDGSFKSEGTASSESLSQVIIALSSLGIDVDTNPLFVKNGKSLLDVLLQFKKADGGFCHVIDGDSDKNASEQALLALASYQRAKENKNALYDFRDAAP